MSVIFSVGRKDHSWQPIGWPENVQNRMLLNSLEWDENRRPIPPVLSSMLVTRNPYGHTRDELRYMLDPQDIYGPDFPGETFRVLKEKEEHKYGEYRTRRLILEAWDRI